jgi:hypothetical protein
MNVTRDEAAQALAEAGEAGDKVVRLKGYHHGAPHFMIWGVVWLVANSVTQFWPDLVNWAWVISIASGAALSTVTGVLQSRDLKPRAISSVDQRIGKRIGMTSGVVFSYIACMMMIAQPETQRESNVMISIIFPFIYMAAGVWAGWRLFAIGLVTLVAIIVGYYTVQEYFALWMGVFAGGSLIAGGVWLRTA